AWDRLFDRDPAVLGRAVTLDAKDVTIVGVLKTIEGIGIDSDIYTVMNTTSPGFRNPRAMTMSLVVGRLRAGIGVGAAQAEMQPIAAAVAHAYPDGRARHRTQLTLLAEYFAPSTWRKLLLFLGASALVLLLSCANVASLI